MDKPVIFLDMDGCLCQQAKIRGEENGYLTCSKAISDHDTWTIDTLKKHAHIIIISGDRNVNELWAKRRGVDFLFTSEDGFHGKKFPHLRRYWYSKFYEAGLTENPEPRAQYYYLGDTLTDYTCMLNARKAFMPADACQTLKRVNDDLEHNFIVLRTKSGEGCFEEMALHLVDMNVLRMKFLVGGQ